MCVKEYCKVVLQEIPSFLVTSHKPLQENKNAESAEIVNQKRTNSYVWPGTSLSTKPLPIKSKMVVLRIKQRFPRCLILSN